MEDRRYVLWINPTREALGLRNIRYRREGRGVGNGVRNESAHWILSLQASSLVASAWHHQLALEQEDWGFQGRWLQDKNAGRVIQNKKRKPVKNYTEGKIWEGLATNERKNKASKMAIINSMKNKKLGKKRIILLAPTRSNGYTVIITYSLNPVLIKIGI